MGRKKNANSLELEMISEEADEQLDETEVRHRIKITPVVEISNQVEYSSHSWSDAEADAENYITEEAINLEKVVEALDEIPVGLKAPQHSASSSIHKPEEVPSYISSYAVSSRSSFSEYEPSPIPFSLEFEPSLVEKMLLPENSNIHKVSKSPSKKQEQANLTITLEEINKFSMMQVDETLKISKLNLELHNLEKNLAQQSLKNEFYLNQLKHAGVLINNEKDEFIRNLKNLEERIARELEQKELLERHLEIINGYFEKMLEKVKENREKAGMECEDYFLRVFAVKSQNRVLREQRKRLNRALESVSSMEECREKNEYLIEVYAKMLKEAAEHFEKQEEDDKEDYNENVMNLLKEVQGLEKAITDFTQDALEDPRKLMPYMRSATPNRTGFIKPQVL